MAGKLSLNDFSPLIGQKFRLKSDKPDQLELELVEADALASRGNAAEREPFSVVFRAAKDCGLWQGIMRMEHESIGAIELFLVPVGNDDEGMYFQAVFN